MKKLTFLFILTLAFNLLWSQTIPTNWNVTTGALTAEEETINVNDGTKAVKLTWTSVDNQDLDSDPFAVTEGATFSASISILDNDPAGRCRIGIYWGVSSGYATTYSADGASWQSNSFTGEVPAGATTAVIRIRCYDVTAGWAGSASLIVDNAIYTENGGSNLIPNASFENWETQVLDPTLTINSPANNAVVNVDNVNIAYTVENFVLGTDGSVEYKLNGGAVSYTTTSPINILGLTVGNNTIDLQLVDIDDQPLDPAVSATITVIYEIPSTDPGLVITSPTAGQNINSNAVNINFTVNNFVLGTDGKLAYSVDGGSVVYQTNNNPIALTGLSYAAHTVNLELVDMSNLSLDPTVTASINFTCSEVLPGGMEPFDNCTATGTYGDGNFVGNNDITWNFYHSRDTGSYPINEKGLMLRRASDSKLESGSIGGGISSFTMNMRKAFTGSSTRQLELYINGELKGTSQAFGGTTGDDPTIYVFSVNDINVTGDFVMMIKCVGSAATNSQVVIDDISWTAYSSTDPYISISSPANNAVIQNTDVDVVLSVGNFTLGTDGQVKYIVDGGAAQYTTNTTISLTGLSEEAHTVSVELVNMSNVSLSPAVTDEVAFTVDMSVPAYTTIHDIQYTTDISGDSPLKDTQVTTRGVVVATYDYVGTTTSTRFWIQDGAGAWNGIYVYYQSTPGPAAGDSVWVSATVSEYYNLTELTSATFTIINTGNTIAPATIVSTGTAGDEMYEGVLVQVEGVNNTAPDTYMQWPVNDGSGDMLVDDLIYDYTPTQGNLYRVTGLVEYSFSEWKLQPRNVNDVVDLGVNSDPTLSITTPVNGSTIYTANTNFAFTVTNFTLGTDGKVEYSVDGGTAYYVTASPVAITGLADGEHTIEAQLVNMSNVAISPAVNSTVTFTVDLAGPVLTPIYDIQYTTDASGDSPMLDETVTIKGVVSAVFNGTEYGEGYYLQQGAGAWNGLYIFDLTNTPVLGDSVMVTGKVSEYFTMTELTNITYYQTTGIGGTIAAPVVLSTLDAVGEMYESVLVKVMNAECTVVQNTYGEWFVNDGSGALMCKDNGAFTFTEVLGTHYDITGVMMYSYGESSLNYRIPSDIVESTSIETDLSGKTIIYPNPANNFISIISEYNLSEINIISTDGKVVMTVNPDAQQMNIDISNLASGFYFIKLQSNDKSGIKKLIVE